MDKPFYVNPAAFARDSERTEFGDGADIHFIAPAARVLIVDDNIINLKVAMGLMQPYSMQILTAESGPAAIEMLRSKDIDLVFMDYMMAEPEGVKVTAFIRGMEGEYYRNLPIIALTANAADGAREAYVSAGFNDFLARPIDPSELDRILRGYLPGESMLPPEKVHCQKWGRRRGDKLELDASRVVDFDRGVAYAGGHEEIYWEVLALFVQKSAEKIPRLGELYEQKDFRGYAQEAHVLKSTSMSIGAVRLSELAGELEAAAREGGPEFPVRRHGELLELLDETADVIRKYLDETGEIGVRKGPGREGPLTEINAGTLRALIERGRAACRGFDAQELAKTAEVASICSFHSGSRS